MGFLNTTHIFISISEIVEVFLFSSLKEICKQNICLKKMQLTNIIDWSPTFGSQNVFEEKLFFLAIDFLSPTFFEEIMGKANIKLHWKTTFNCRNLYRNL